MTRIIALAVLLAAAGCKGGGDTTMKPKDAEFCPGCQTFCGEGCPKGADGACKACGKVPSKVQACDVSWYWCGHHNAWHDGKPCGDDASKKCCAASKGSVAMCVPRNTEGVEKAAYCPECRCFCGAECPLDDKGNCKKCNRPPVKVDSMSGPWFWCTEHAVWHQGKTCKANDDKKCCAETRTRVLVCFRD